MQNNHFAALVYRTAVLMNEDDGERSNTLGELLNALRNPQTYKTRSRAVLDNKEAMEVLLNLSATARLASVLGNALGVLLQVARDLDNARRLFREHPSLILVARHKLEFEAESASEQVQVKALGVLNNLACNDDNARSMTAKNPTLVSLLVAKVELNSEQMQVGALGVLQNLAINDNARDMVTKNPTLVQLLMGKADSNSERVQIKTLIVLKNLAVNVDNRRDMVIKNPTLVPLLVAKVGSISKEVQLRALRALSNLAVNDNAREIVTRTPRLVPLLMAKVESNSEQVQVNALIVLNNLAVNDDNAREMVTQHPTLVFLIVAKVGSNSEQVQGKALSVLQILALHNDNAREMVTQHPMLVLLLVAKMTGATALSATKAVYGLSCCPANRAILRRNDSVVAALTKGREKGNKSTSLFSLLALVNLFGAEEDLEVLKTDLAMLREIFKEIQSAMNKRGRSLNFLLLAFRYLCVVEHNRQLLWSEYGSEFLTSVLAALQRAIDNKNDRAAENAVSTLVQFSSDPEPLVWMRGNKPRLDEVFDRLAPFPEALRTAQSLLLVVAPPVAAVSEQS